MPIRPWRDNWMLIYCSCLVVFLLPSRGLGTRTKQEPGDCGCAPSLYTFRLNFSLDCDDRRFQNPEQIRKTTCLISHEEVKPTAVQSIVVEETSFKGVEPVSEEGSGFFGDGAIFSFRSNLLPPNDIAKELRMVLIGLDELGTTLITNEIKIELSNICGTTPVFENGDAIGWLEILSSTMGPEYCIPTPSPSLIPSVLLTSSSLDPRRPFCACSPTRYSLELDLELTCDDSNIQSPTVGVESTFCFVASQTSERPMEITDVTMIEVDEDFEVINQQSQQGRFVSGDILEFETIALRNNSLPILPRAVQFSMSGINVEGDKIDQTWIIQYTNDCGEYPVLMGVNEQIGWTGIRNLGPANEVYCRGESCIDCTCLDLYGYK